ncbi:deoxynucleoside kinase [Alkalihalobacterium chitinilyticum]|uniref:Deoxynucleoside kinase n=1 Tax=Alkalihalobacterium chitinilyticum TaxID=2980103 RepID=A0ABT5VM47_9BACI|nr:deoxynucleoside kinase [Alkalihalobacterium chitinilyticum]MDE5415349.1 deoxynucleoside kinase [Alkalihalobacterium chitinilyticum]
MGDDQVIVLGGMIGVGKSSYADAIGKYYGTEVFFESVDNNPILDKFYSDQKRYGFMLQMYFLGTRFNAIKKAFHHRRSVLDRSIYEDALFTQVNYELGNIAKEEKMVYDMVFKEMMEEIEGMPKKAPDLFIYLRANFDTIMYRIGKRGRDFEQDEKLIEYYRYLHSKYDEWIYNSYDASQVLTIDANKYDIHQEEDAKQIFSLVDSKLGLMKI